MNKNQEELRKRAMSLLKRNPERLTQTHIDDINKIIEELNIYQVELELQNDELRSTQLQLEKSRNEYIDLFETAPNGYVIINGDFEILSCNQTFSNIIKYAKANILGQSITHFIHPDFQDIAYLCLNSLFSKTNKSNCEIKIIANGDYPQYYRIDGILEKADSNDKTARLSFTNIHKEKRHEQELSFNSQLFEKIEDAIISVDSLGYVNYINKKAEMLTAVAQKDAIHAHIEEVIHLYHPKNDLNEYTPMDFFDGLTNDKDQIAKCINIENKEYFLEFRVSAIQNPNSGKPAYLVFFRDKTEDFVNQLMLEVRTELITYSVNHTLDELLVKALDEVENLTQSRIAFYHFIDKDQKNIHLQEWSTSTKKNFCRAEAKGMHYRLEKAGVWADALRQKKSIIHNDYKKMPFKKGLPDGHAEVIREMVVPVMRDGQVVAMLGVGNKKSDYTPYDVQRMEYIADVTWEIVKQKKLTEELAKSQAFLQNVFNAIQDGINVVDQDLKIIASNKWIQNTFDYSGSLNGVPCFKAFKGSNNICKDCPSNKTLITKKPHTGVVEHKKDGTDLKYFEITTFPILDENNDIRSIIEYIKDVTDRHIAQNELILTNEELKIAKQKAEESDRLKSAFLANMSHEIRTPMNGILGFAELLKEPGLSIDEHEQFLAVIERSGERMLNIINDLIDLSKIESNLMEVNLSEVNINKQLEYLFTFFKLEARKKGLKLEYIKGTPDSDTIIHTDKDKLTAIFINLIKNALKYTKEGQISFGYSIITDHIEFFVKDTGLGIAKDAHNKIFDRFVQVDQALTSKYEGAGLGLAITKGYLKLLGGDIRLESKFRKGSTFYFTLPLSLNKSKKNNHSK